MKNCLIKNISKTVIYSLFLSALLILVNYGAANAQSGYLTVSPARQQITIKPGESSTINIKFYNQGDLPVTGNVGVADFIVVDNKGTVKFLDGISGLSSNFAAASWVKLSPAYEEITIQGQDKVIIPMSISVPGGAKPGGRYFGIYLEPISSVPLSTGSEREAGAATKSRLAGLVYVRVAGPIEEKASIVKFFTRSFIEYGPAKVTTDIINRGSYHITPKGQIALYDIMGRKIDEKTLEEVNIFPDSSRKYENELGKQVMLGKFNLKLTATYGETGQVLTATATFWAFPVRIVLVIILSLIIIILIAMIVWKKVKGRQSKLEKKLEEEIKELEDLKEKVSDKLPSPPSKK